MSTDAELLQLNQRLLESIAGGDWATYESLCQPGLTCFEPETGGHLVEGMAFHKFYFDLSRSAAPRVTTTMSGPHVRMLGTDAAVISYTRLVQRVDELGEPITARTMETRIWQREGGQWRHVHFHRSPA